MPDVPTGIRRKSILPTGCILHGNVLHFGGVPKFPGVFHSIKSRWLLVIANCRAPFSRVIAELSSPALHHGRPNSMGDAMNIDVRLEEPCENIWSTGY